MITLNDCVAFCDADAAMIDGVASEEHLPEVLAIAKAHARLQCANSPIEVGIDIAAPMTLQRAA